MTVNPTVRSKVTRLGTWPGKPWSTCTSLTTHKGVHGSIWSLWKTWEAAMRAARQDIDTQIRLERKSVAETAALAEFERTYGRAA